MVQKAGEGAHRQAMLQTVEQGIAPCCSLGKSLHSVQASGVMQETGKGVLHLALGKYLHSKQASGVLQRVHEGIHGQAVQQAPHVLKAFGGVQHDVHLDEGRAAMPIILPPLFCWLYRYSRRANAEYLAHCLMVLGYLMKDKECT